MDTTWRSAFLSIITKGLSALKTGKLFNFFVNLYLYLLRAIASTKQITATSSSMQKLVREQNSEQKQICDLAEHSISPIADSDWGFFCDMQAVDPPANENQTNIPNQYDETKESPPQAPLSHDSAQADYEDPQTCNQKLSPNADGGTSNNCVVDGTELILWVDLEIDGF